MRQRTLQKIGALWVVLLGATSVQAQAYIVVETPGVGTPSVLVGGDLVSVPLSVLGGRSGIAAVDLTLRCEGTGIRIKSVTFDSAFALPLVENAALLPGSVYSCTRAQPMASVDPMLGVGDRGVSLCEVALEATTAEAFSAELVVQGRVSSLDAQPGPTITTATGEAVPVSEVRIPIINLGSADPQPFLAPLVNEAPVTLEVYEPNGQIPVSEVTVGETYELHYVSSVEDLSGYNLFVVDELPGRGLSSAVAPNSGDWANSGSFTFNELPIAENAPPAIGYAGEFRRYQQISDSLSGAEQLAGSSGYLCDIVPRGMGSIRFDLTMWQLDAENLEAVELKTQLELASKLDRHNLVADTP